MKGSIGWNLIFGETLMGETLLGETWLGEQPRMIVKITNKEIIIINIYEGLQNSAEKKIGKEFEEARKW